MSRAAIAGVLMLVALGAAGAPFVIGAAIQDSETTYEPRHTFNPDNTTFTFQESHIEGATYYDNETVRNNSGGVVSESEYTWHTSNGTLTIPDTSKLADDSNASIEFAYTGQTPRQARATDVVEREVDLLVPLAIVVAAAFAGAVMLGMRGLV